MTRRLAIAASAMLVAGACAREASPAPVFSREDCRRVALIDADGAPIFGVEDIAVFRPGDGKGDGDGDAQLILSAYDRSGVERALARNRPAPTGGIYELAWRALVAAARAGTPAAPVTLAAGDDLAGGVRPHGVDVAA
ncbi:MAG: hypothetical protein AAGC56_07540, partial [Pseudomonadota bacterium]